MLNLIFPACYIGIENREWNRWQVKQIFNTRRFGKALLTAIDKSRYMWGKKRAKIDNCNVQLPVYCMLFKWAIQIQMNIHENDPLLTIQNFRHSYCELLSEQLLEISEFLRQHTAKEIQTNSTMAVPESILCTNALMWEQIKKKKAEGGREGGDILQCSVNVSTVREIAPTHPGNRTKAQLGHWFCPVCSSSSTAKNLQDKFLKRRFSWKFRGLLQWNMQFVRQAGYSGANWGVWSTWRGQVLVLLQNLLHNKSYLLILKPQTLQPALSHMSRNH